MLEGALSRLWCWTVTSSRSCTQVRGTPWTAATRPGDAGVVRRAKREDRRMHADPPLRIQATRRPFRPRSWLLMGEGGLWQSGSLKHHLTQSMPQCSPSGRRLASQRASKRLRTAHGAVVPPRAATLTLTQDSGVTLAFALLFSTVACTLGGEVQGWRRLRSREQPTREVSVSSRTTICVGDIAFRA